MELHLYQLTESNSCNNLAILLLNASVEILLHQCFQTFRNENSLFLFDKNKAMETLTW